VSLQPLCLQPVPVQHPHGAYPSRGEPPPQLLDLGACHQVQTGPVHFQYVPRWCLQSLFIKYFPDRFLLGFQGHFALVAGGHPAPDGSDFILQHFSPAGSVSWSWLLPLPGIGRSGPEGSGATRAERSPPGWRRGRCPKEIPDSATRWPTPVNAYAGAASCALLQPALPQFHSRSDRREGNCPRIVGVEDPNARPCTPPAKAFGLHPRAANLLEDLPALWLHTGVTHEEREALVQQVFRRITIDGKDFVDIEPKPEYAPFSPPW